MWRSCDNDVPNMELKMSRGMPSMTALLGLLAIAGYQNRDKLTELLRELAAPRRVRVVLRSHLAGYLAIWAGC